MLIQSISSGAEVYLGKTVDIKKRLGITPLVYEYSAKTKSEDLIFTLQKDGCKMITTKGNLQWDQFHALEVKLEKK